MTQLTTDFARSRLQQAIASGVANAGPVIQHVLNNQPTDDIVRVPSTSYGWDSKHNLELSVPGHNTWTLHDHARDQVFDRLGGSKFTPYARELANPSAEAWQAQLLLDTLDRHAVHTTKRWLVRSINGQARGVLSDKYRRLDCRPLLDAFIGEAQSLGAVPYDGVVSELRCSVRAILPRVIEPVTGEALTFGLSWTNSDYGKGGYEVSLFVLRLVCLNGMVGSSQMKQIHLGKALPDEIELSKRTYALDTLTTASTTKDIVRAALSPTSIDKYVATIQQAAQADQPLAAQWAAIGKVLTKGELDEVKAAFEGPDVIKLPVGHTPWRLSNALSWVANNEAVKPERKLELQAMAGQVI